MLAWAREIERHIPKSPGWWYGLSQLLLQWTFVPLFRVRLFGRANVPAEGGVLIVCNHQSFLDPMLIGMALPRPVEFLARKSLFKNPFFGWLIRSVHALPIEREGRDVHAIKDAIRRLREGHVMLLFPEGTRTRDGSIGPMRAGLSTIVVRSQCAVVPTVIQGAFEAWPRTQRLFRMRPIKVAFGKPIAPSDDMAGLSDEIKRRMDELVRFLAGVAR